MNLIKRTWHYVQNPKEYEIFCDKCNGNDIEWSEFEGHIWCYSCGLDVQGTGGIFDGPIPLGACKVLGISFDRWDMVNNCVLRYDEKQEKYLPLADSKKDNKNEK